MPARVDWAAACLSSVRKVIKMISKPTGRADKLIDEIRDRRAGVWSGAIWRDARKDADCRHTGGELSRNPHPEIIYPGRMPIVWQRRDRGLQTNR